MRWSKTYHRTGVVIFVCCIIIAIASLMARLGYLMIVQSDYYNELSEELHTRERKINKRNHL